MTTRSWHVKTVLALALLTLVGCASSDGGLALRTMGRGLANLVLSPLMIVSGLAQGLAFLPYTIGTGLAELNRALLQAQATSLDDSYKATFAVPIDDERVDKRTGEVAGESLGFGRNRPEAIIEATRAFQRLLVSQGMPEDTARHYVICANYSQTLRRGHVLLAVVYRHSGAEPIRVTSKHTGIVTTLRPTDRGWYEAYERDLQERPIDEVIDWAGVDYAVLRQDKVVATLMALASEAVKTAKRSPDHWAAERRWMAGESADVMRESLEKVKRALPA
jgi:hypothetical protein